MSGIQLFGFSQALGQLRNMKGQFAEAGRAVAFMGTVAPYATFVNDGTRHISPRQFMEKGRARAAASVEADNAEAQKIWDVAAEEGSETALALARKWRNETRGVILDENIWLTGNLFSSMALGKTEAELEAASNKQSLA